MKKESNVAYILCENNYLKQHGLQINGIEVDLAKRVLNHTRWDTTRDKRVHMK